LELIFNTSENHKRVAEAVQQMWTKYLNIHVRVRNLEWATFLKDRRNQNYDIARDAWIADYPDPSTFLDLLESTNGNNDPGWKNSDYDSMLVRIRQETDAVKRMELYSQAESFLLEEAPILPLYTYSSNVLLKPYVRGFEPNPMDEHHLSRAWIDYHWREHSGAQESNGD
jgi:ABC-type oligopeptide transport system substrate-binding subunit